ncbi:MAG: hypothetical protein ACR2MX_04150 [Cyclobacteriaceae bacterium]
MTGSSKIIDILRLFSVLFLALILVVESAAFSYSGNINLVGQASEVDLEVRIQQSEQDQDESDQGFEIKAQEAIVTVAQLNLTQALFFIYELKLVKETDFQVFHHQTLPGHQYFHTLFRLIIAPNAP